MIPVNDALFILQAVRQDLLDFERARRLVQSLSSGAATSPGASAYRLSIDYGYLSREQAAYLRTVISDLLHGPDWEPEDLIRELGRIASVRVEPDTPLPTSPEKGARGERRLSQRIAGRERSPVLAALLQGFLRNLAVSLAFVLILGGVLLMIIYSDPSDPAGETAKPDPRPIGKSTTRRPGTVPVPRKAREPVREKNGTGEGKDGLSDRTFEIPPNLAGGLREEYERAAKKARIHLGRGEFAEAFEVLEAFQRKAEEEYWIAAVARQLEAFRLEMRAEFAVLMGNFTEAMARDDAGLARAILEQAQRYTLPKGTKAFAAKLQQCRRKLDDSADPSGRSVAPWKAEDLAAFSGAARGRADGRVEVLYDFSQAEQANDWWTLGLLGRVRNGAMETPQADLAWPGTSWLIHKGEFERIHRVEFLAKVNQIDDSKTPHLGFGLHLAPVPDGPWEAEQVEQGGIAWLRPDGLGVWVEGLSAWSSGDTGVALQAGRTYRFVAEFEGSVASWWIDGQLLRRTPVRLKSLGPRLVIMVGGGAVELDDIRLIVTPNAEWLRDEGPRAQSLRAEVAKIRLGLESDEGVELIRERRLPGLCYNPRQYCRACAELGGDDELCVRDDLGPFIPARLPIELKGAELSGQIKPIAKGARDWYFGFLQNGVSGYSLALYLQKAYIGLNLVESRAVHPAVENVEEAFNIPLGEGEYHPFALKFRPGKISFELSEYPVLTIGGEWTRGGELSLGGYNWGGVGHYHFKDLKLKLLR